MIIDKWHGGHTCNKMSHSTSKLGTAFTWLGWIVGFLILALLFDRLLDHQQNPNRSVQTVRNAGHEEIVLQRNRYGHYLFNGKINDQVVTFLVDTGATTTSIPAHLAERLDLRKGYPFQVETANGRTTAYSTRIDRLRLGEMEFYEVNASLNPGLKSEEVLLGMNILKRMELIQRGDKLIIRSPSS